jgi:lipopolysaccharide transport system permease protein
MMYATTVIYPLSAAPVKYKWLIELNPMTGIIEAFRFGFLGQGELTNNTFGYSVVFTLISLVLGVLIFNKTEKTFVDTV